MQQVNLVGIIFPITNSAYQLLKSYRLGLYRYFVQQTDGEEVLADLEHHMAEIFWEITENNMLPINDATVNTMIARMGNVADFEEAELNPAYSLTYEEEPKVQEKMPHKEALPELPARRSIGFAPYTDDIWSLPALHNPIERTEPEEEAQFDTHRKRLYRDTKRCMLGGVAAGFGFYIQIDIVWVRLVCLAILLGLIPMPIITTSTAIMTYILLWAVLPKNEQLPEIEVEKRLYRELSDAQVAGVCTGIARYFGWEKKRVRLAFILSSIGGIGVIAYAALWAIMPKKVKREYRKAVSVL